MGPWQLGAWYRPAAVLSVLGCLGLIVIGMQPPNERAVYVVGGTVLVLAAAWWLRVRQTFPGPPQTVLTMTSVEERDVRLEPAAATIE
jgi:hypothetical protein